jgi:hypothetical protein
MKAGGNENSLPHNNPTTIGVLCFFVMLQPAIRELQG